MKTLSEASSLAEIHECDVAIIGGGPVGLGLAIELGQRGISSTVSEKSFEPSPIPKGQNLTQRTMEHFRVWGIETAVRASRAILPGSGIGGLTCYGSLLSKYNYDWFKRAVVGPYYAAENERLPQYATENALRARVGELNQVKFLKGSRAVSLRQDDETVKVEIRQGERRSEIKARYAVGCDGSHSMTRKAAGISETISDHERLMCLLVFRSEELHELLGGHPGKSFFNVLHPELDGYWKFFGKVDASARVVFPCAGAGRDDSQKFRYSRISPRSRGLEIQFRFAAYRILASSRGDGQQLQVRENFSRRGFRPQPSSLRGLRDQHRLRRRPESRLEARIGRERLQRRSVARNIR